MNIASNEGSKARFSVLGCKISRVNMTSAIDHVIARIASKRGGYVCFTNVHVCVMGHQVPSYAHLLNSSDMTVADGKPIYWVARWRNLRDVGHVPGPDFLFKFLEAPGCRELRHYFFGSRPEVIAALQANLERRFPGLQIAGSFSPPFRPLSTQEVAEMVENIRQTAPDVVWVGLGAPRQEMWMAEHWPRLRPAVLFGVGAAFDFGAGTIKRAPPIFTRVGLEWLYRLAREPKRLWRRYLSTNFLFMYYLIVTRHRNQG